MINIASEPIDIVWSNMGGTMGVFLFRRLFVNIAMVIILLFFSTPATMLSALSSADIFNLVSFEWVKSLPYGGFIKSHMPPIIILGIN